jgi:hypothetical protein
MKKEKIIPFTAIVCVNRIAVKIKPIKTLHDKLVDTLYLEEGQVHVATGPQIFHMGCGFFEDEFKKELLHEIKRIGKQEWKRVINILNSVNFDVVPKKAVKPLGFK